MDFTLLAHKAAHGSKGLTLENLDDDLPEGGDSALGSYAEACDAQFEDSEVQSQALEAIRDHSDQLASMINCGECNAVALGLIRHAVQQQARRMGRELTMPALEDVETISIEAQSTIALESFKNFLNNVVQEFVLGFKHHKDLIGEFLRTTSEITAKYEKKTLENSRHWVDVKKEVDLGADVSVGANGLLYFFAKGTQDPTVGKLLGSGKLLEALKEDVKVSKYILTQYPKAVMQEMKSLASILRSANFKRSGDIIKMASQVEKLKTPVELFDSKYHSQELLGAAQLHAQAPRTRKLPPATTYKAMPRMAEMAGAKHVGYKGSNNMKFLRASGAVSSAAGATALNVAAPGIGTMMYGVHKLSTALPTAALTSTKEMAFTFKVKEIETVLDIAEAYLDNVRACVGYEREIVRVMDELDAAIERANNSSDDVVEELIKLEKTDRDGANKGWNEFQEACHVFEQIMAFANALRRAIQKPVHGEAARSLRAAKYCNYLALRAMYNADRKQVSTEDYEEPSPAMKAKYEQTKHQYDKLKAEEAHATGARLEVVKAHLSRLSRELRGHDLWPLTMADKHEVATEGRDEDAQENIRKMDEALDALHVKYEAKLKAAAHDEAKFKALKQEQAHEEFNIRQKFNLSHPALENLDEAKFHKGQHVAGVGRIVDVRMNGPKLQYLVKEDEEKNEYATAEESGDSLKITHRHSSHSDEAARTLYNFTGKEKVVSMENHDEAPPADAAPATNASDDVTPAAEKAEGEAEGESEGEDIHTKHAKRMKRLNDAHDQQQKLLKDADSPEKHGVAKEAVKNLVAQMQQALAEYQEQVDAEEAPATESIDPQSFGSRFARAFKK
jgi:hypothetical protein